MLLVTHEHVANIEQLKQFRKQKLFRTNANPIRKKTRD